MSVHIEEVPKDLEEQVEELHAQVVIYNLSLCYICTASCTGAGDSFLLFDKLFVNITDEKRKIERNHIERG